jgi:hypothetical protein
MVRGALIVPSLLLRAAGGSGPKGNTGVKL